MKIRSITLFSPIIPQDKPALRPLATLGTAARGALEQAGYEVQTVRLATPPWPRFFDDTAAALHAAQWLDRAAPKVGIDYLSLGPVEAVGGGNTSLIESSTAILAATERVFCTTLIADTEHGVNVGAARASAEAIVANAALEPNGFGNLRFAVLANVRPGSPFFPAAYTHPGYA
ncbi:MAG: DUF711 family protein, partial [Chloroflexota bacterium]|nr:DUF711 family protein [Chloroflexota bacterium]